MVLSVRISKKAQKDLTRVPHQMLDKLEAWILAVQKCGIENVRRIAGFHDEPLKGARKGQRSIRLSRSYRALYSVVRDNSIEFVLIEEVSKHAY